MVDLDSTKLTPPTGGYDEIPPLPEPEGTVLKNHLKQVSIPNICHIFLIGILKNHFNIFFLKIHKYWLKFFKNS